MKKVFRISVSVGIALVLGAVGYLFARTPHATVTPPDIPVPQPVSATKDYKNSTYTIEGEEVLLVDGLAETSVAPGSASKKVTRYFGNELWTDLNNDNKEDVVFLVTQEMGGSGTFFYVVAAVSGESGYQGSDGYLLGDRIAPQTTEVSQNPRHKAVVVVNYADRMLAEPMTAVPSVGKSIYLKLDTEQMQWGVVEPAFEGESL